MIRSIALLAAIVLLSSSCATIFAKDTRSIIVTSNPAGAQITVNGVNRGVTPTRLSVNDHERLEVAIRKPGYHPGGCYVNTSVRALWVIIDLALFYTVVPLVVDLVTNEWSQLESGYCTVNLLPMQ